MATKAERARAAAERTTHRSKKASRKAPGGDSRKKRKATYALEPPRKGRPSRKSTRKAANRAKPDSAFNITEEVRRGAPSQLYRKTRARAAHPRGHRG